MKKVLYSITSINILFQCVYSVLGKYTESELELLKLKWVFYLFRPEYLVISGVFSLLALIVLLFLFIKKKGVITLSDIAIFIMNIEYWIYYLNLLSIQ